MNGSFHLGTVFGIPIRMHWSFPLVLMLFIPQSGPLMGTFVALLLFGCVLLHELGHSVTAQRFGVRVLDITFWPLGGMARMTNMPEVPRIECLIALAGPAVNFLLAAFGLVLWPFTHMLGAPALGLLELFISINLILGTFNLLPAFPMDGGRVLRAWFARRADWVSATERAVGVGRFLAGGMLVFSVVTMLTAPQMVCALPLISLFIWVSGGQELIAVRLRHGKSPFSRSSLFGAARGPTSVPWSRPAQGPSSTRAAPEGDADDADVEGAQRPGAWEPTSLGQGGFDEQAIRALERYRGRLKRSDDAGA